MQGNGIMAALAFVLALGLSIDRASADYAAGLAAFDAGDYAAAFQQWEPEAAAGNAKAQHGLAVLYETGRGVPSVDVKKAAELYEKAAKQDYAPAISNLARLYEDGRGVTQDHARALQLWRQAVELGNATAMYNLATHFADGISVDQDPVEAAKYFRLAAEKGLPEGLYAMALITRGGIGVPADEIAAAEWLRKAAEAGHSRAKMDIAAQAHVQTTNAGEAMATGAETTASEEPALETPTAAAEATAEAEGESADEAADAPASETNAETPLPPGPSAEQTPQASEQPSEEQALATGGASQAISEGSDAALEETKPAEAPMAASPSATDGEGVLYLALLREGPDIFRIWLGQSGQESDAKSQWAKFQQQFSPVAGKLELDLRRYYLGEAKGSIYRIFAGPFDDREAAASACRSIRNLAKDQFCRVVIN